MVSVRSGVWCESKRGGYRLNGVMEWSSEMKVCSRREMEYSEDGIDCEVLEKKRSE